MGQCYFEKKDILKELCGYYRRAPSDKGGASVRIVQDFTVFLTLTQIPPVRSKDYVLDAWLEANLRNKALGIVYTSSQFWKVVARRWPFEDEVAGPFNW